MLLLNLATLKSEFTSFSGYIPATVLHERLTSEYFRVSKDSYFKVKARKSYDYYEVEGSVSGEFEQLCGRCLDFVERQFDVSFKAIIKLRSGDDEEEDDIGLYFSDDEVFNLEELLLEQIILQLNPFWLPDTVIVDGTEVCSACKKPVEIVKPAVELNGRKLLSSEIKEKLKKVVK